MIRLSNLSFAYGSKKVLEDFSLELSAGETVMITGPNGVGKSTILRLLAGVLIPVSGDIDHGLPEGIDPRLKTAFLPDSLSIYRSMTPTQAAEYHAGIYNTEPSDLELALKAGIDVNSIISDLSVGQRVLVHLSLILSTDPELILIDEVLHSVDPYLRDIVFRQLIAVMEKRNPTVVMVNLNFHEIEHLADRVVFLGRDGIRLDESVDDLKAKTRRVIAEEISPEHPILLTESVMGSKQHIVYPFDERVGSTDFESIQEMDLTEIMTAFMGGEYGVS
ncbi:MAG: ATP-binding cassette domain-containing protein [Candidatus Fermentibacteraceae bacterium]|nr:ATP-binding cassette domain-containing protein [Candidatus Fermentibacteraceae bacterium]